MTDSIGRKVVALAVLLTSPFLILIFFLVADLRVRLGALLLAGAVAGLAWFFAQRLAARIQLLTGFVDRMLEQTPQKTALKLNDDELGELARSLTRISPRIDEMVNGLSVELKRREAVLDSMTEAVLAVDAQCNVTFCNRAFRQAVGDHGTKEGAPLVKIARDPDLLRVLKQVVDSGEPVRRRVRLAGPEGRSFEVNAAPLANSSSRGAIAIFRDVTPQEHLERVKRDFIANVSHEFRTPLATIRGYAETLLDGGLEDLENRQKFVEIIQANAMRLNNIAADLLILSDLEQGRPEPEPSPIAIKEALMSAVHAVEPAARLRGIAIRLGSIPDAYFLGYGIRFEQAVLNLLDNAVKFNKDDGEVGVEVRRNDSRIEVIVWDTGIGIPPLDLSRVFERFYRVDKARSRRVGGTGLGLSIVKHAIEQMNGSISVESTAERGSRFTISLPEFEVRPLSS